MKRILVTGNAGSGKTTLSRKLASSMRLPLYGLDAIVWKTGWEKTPDQEKREKIRQMTASEAWIIDGVSGQAFKAADKIYFLDLPLYKCLFNIFKRFLANGPTTRDTLPPNCPEYIGVFKALKVAFAYQKKTRPFIIELIGEYPEKEVVWIKNHSEILI